MHGHLWQRLLLRTSQQKVAHRLASTVYALSSGQGKCGVALVRVTGERAKDVFSNMTLPSTLPPPRVAALRRIVHPVTGEGLDRGLVLWFPGPQSFTGEDSCELHVHGGPAVIAAVLSALSTLPGYHPAQPGDFTKRSFYNGKLDLTSVEGLGDLIHAETEAQRKQALRQMEGALAQLYNRWRQTLLCCRASLEAYIDFSEDENIEEGVIEEVETKIRNLIQELEQHLSDDRRGERLRSGLQLAILGKPNVGKSSFLNTMIQRPASIVSSIPGTTRDVIETSLDLGGYPVIISDTAGLRQTDDIVEMEGVRRAMMRAQQADIAVVIIDAQEVLPFLKSKFFDWNTFLIRYFKEIGIYECNKVDSKDSFAKSDSLHWLSDNNYITIINKMDLVECDQDRNLLVNSLKDSCVLLSLKTQEGFSTALQKLKNLCASLCEGGTAESPFLTAARHRTHISACLGALKLMLGSEDKIPALEDLSYEIKEYSYSETKSGNSYVIFSDNQDFVGKTSEDNEPFNLLHSEETVLMAAHYLHKAATNLGHVTGHITTEDVLNQIFSAFCIGK